MNELARAWIRRIAMGLPIAPLGVVVSGCWCSYGPCPDIEYRFPIDEEVAAQIVSADHDEDACNTICTSLQSWAADGGIPNWDAGWYPPSISRTHDCALSAEGDMLYADCAFYQACGGGRRPAGLVAAPRSTKDEAGAWLAEMAWMEAASVTAFEELARDLSRFGAPRVLIEGARRAAIDEARHARLVGNLARARGVAPPPVVMQTVRTRSLLEIACENAAEGGVRETYGTLIAAHQAAHARDRDVRVAMASIARDEARHALLSDAIDRWARTKIAGPEQLDAARGIAAREASAGVRKEVVSPAAAAALGLPNASERAQLAAALA